MAKKYQSKGSKLSKKISCENIEACIEACRQAKAQHKHHNDKSDGYLAKSQQQAASKLNEISIISGVNNQTKHQ